MTLFAVILRELRAEARNAVTSWLRVAGAAIVILILWMVTLNFHSRQELGPALFRIVHQTMLVLIWLLVPVMTSDCIARERREGTLGLLFLTPLKAREIVVG